MQYIVIYLKDETVDFVKRKECLRQYILSQSRLGKSQLLN